MYGQPQSALSESPGVVRWPRRRFPASPCPPPPFGPPTPSPRKEPPRGPRPPRPLRRPIACCPSLQRHVQRARVLAAARRPQRPRLRPPGTRAKAARPHPLHASHAQCSLPLAGRSRGPRAAAHPSIHSSPFLRLQCASKQLPLCLSGGCRARLHIQKSSDSCHRTDVEAPLEGRYSMTASSGRGPLCGRFTRSLASPPPTNRYCKLSATCE